MTAALRSGRRSVGGALRAGIGTGARRFLPLPIRALARRLPALIEASADMVRAELEARGYLETTDMDKEAISA